MRRFAVIGSPIEHSLSPQIYQAAFHKLGIQATYEKQEVKPEELAEFMAFFRRDFSGMNVTIPHKQAIIAYLDELDAAVKNIGAVNTVQNKNGTLKGWNTDAEGALQALKKGGAAELKGKRAVILGAGGAARAIAYALLKNGAEVEIFNRHRKRAEALAQELGAVFSQKIRAGALADFKGDADLLINSTSAGLAPKIEETPLPDLPKILAAQGRSKPCVMDIVYRPRKTRFLRDAQAAGCTIVTGDRMLLHQAALAFRIWTGREAPFKTMEKALQKALMVSSQT